MRKPLIVAAALLALPSAAQAWREPGFYIGAEGGLNWMLDSTAVRPQTGWLAGAMVGYDFAGLRLEIEGIHRSAMATLSMAPAGTAGMQIDQTAIMANAFYDFDLGGALTPYVGAGAGIAFVNAAALGGSSASTQFAYQAIVGVGYTIDRNWRLNIDGRYFGTTASSLNNAPIGSANYSNNNFSIMASLQFKLAQAAEFHRIVDTSDMFQPYRVFFGWDRSDLSPQALGTIKMAAAHYQNRGEAHVIVTGHSDNSGPDVYNAALSLRRANAVKIALIRGGVPEVAISVIGKGVDQPLVGTGAKIREPQNRRVEIWIK